jgi:hypothetical protein
MHDDREARMDDRKLTSVGRLLAKLSSEDRPAFDRLALMAAIPVQRLERAMSNERCLRPMEQLRLAEWLIRYAPALRRQAFALRGQVLATERMSAGETTCHGVAPMIWR